MMVNTDSGLGRTVSGRPLHKTGWTRPLPKSTAFTCAHLGLSTEPRENHAQYIQSWLRVLKADFACHLYGRIQGAASNRLDDRAGRGIGPHYGGGGMTTHRSSAYGKAIGDRGRAWKPEPITNQLRFIVRMAYACHAANVPYDLSWDRAESAMCGTLTATGNIPMPKPLPKAPKLKVVSDWKPTIWDAAYRLDAYHDAATGRMRPGFAIAHSCGLALVHPSESG